MRRAVMGAQYGRRSEWLAAALVTMLAACGGGAGQGEGPGTGPPPAATAPTLERDEVRSLMEHAARAVDRDLVVAVTDRRGVILGVGANFAIDATACEAPNPTPGTDCAVASFATQLARTAAFFSADQTPLTSRSIRFISDIHFPPRIDNTGAAALFGIENTNRGCSFDAAAGDGLFEADQVIPRARSLAATLVDLAGAAPLACESGGSRAGCTTGIATLPGGVPIFKNGRLAGGIGVFLRGQDPGPDSEAAPEGDVVLRRQDGDPDFDVGEFAARAFAGDVKAVVPTVVDKGLVNVCANTAIARPACCADPVSPCTFSILPNVQRIDPVIFIDGIEVPEVANDPPVEAGSGPVARALSFVMDPAGAPAADVVPGGWLVGPRDSSPGVPPIGAAEVRAIIDTGVAEARRTRAAIRLPLEERTAMILAVSDANGVLLGLYRMDDATVFSIDVAVAKSRNVIWFSNPAIDPVDTRDSPGLDVTIGTAYEPGTAITNRTLSFGAQPLFPSGIDGTQPGPFRRVFLFDSANPCTNGQEPENGRQNGIVFFPGSAPLYRDGTLIGGFGVSGDGVEQDDIVTNAGANAPPGFEPPSAIRADRVKVRGVRLPYLKFNRQPNQ
ncbi:MAG: heme-binding protein [Deltaproteobacteria bacterium]|nr:heme-binding protein [Deltaproteobacteria bacterium]